MAANSAKSVGESKAGRVSINETIRNDAQKLSANLKVLIAALNEPLEQKALRRFSSGEVSRILGVTNSYVRMVATQEDLANEQRAAGARRTYSLEEIHALRRTLGKTKPTYLPGRRPGNHMQVVAVTNFKGGSGKTTSSMHLAQYLALRGYRVLAVDLDPQASMTSMLGASPEFDVGDLQTIYGAVRYSKTKRPIADIVRKTYFPGLDLIPGNLELHEFEHDTAKVLGQAETGQVSSDTDAEENPEMFFLRIGNVLQDLDEHYDVVVLDCPPNLGFLTMSAMFAATSVLVTVHPQMLDVASMNQFLSMTSALLDVVKQANDDMDEGGEGLEYDWMRYLVTRYEPNDGPQAQIVAFLRSLFGERVLTSMMVKSTAVSDAGLSQQTIYEAARETMNRQTYDRAVEAMDAVNSEVEALIKKAWGRK